MVVEERHSGLAKERDSRQVQNRIPQLAEGFSYQGLTEKESLLVQGGFLLFPFSFLAEGSFWERRMPLEVEILRNKKKKKTCPCRHLPHPSNYRSFKGFSKCPGSAAWGCRGPVLRELGAGREACSFPFLSRGPRLH